MNTLQQTINEHTSLIDKIEQLEEEKRLLEEKILAETEGLNKEELLDIYLKLRNSKVKYQLALKIKNMVVGVKKEQ